MPRFRLVVAVALLAWAGSIGCGDAGGGTQPEAGSADLAIHDTAVRDTRDFDAPSSDAFLSDAYAIDSSQRDKSPPDVGGFDAPATEGSRPELGSFDAPEREASRPDVGSFEASPPDDALVDAGSHCFSCEGYLICGGEGQIDLTPAADGCYLSGLSGRKLLAADGTITEGGALVGKAVSRGAGVDISNPDGGSWLICRRPVSCNSTT